ncbi:GNAT family N-acetyltransferase [Jannaschia sp. R86511]|uniref:GNAT family N-acetyltransferase n=1 Tax=Jannaschia sp. R86511 TaxID=3093853 RepID=UPI0036D2360E
MPPGPCSHRVATRHDVPALARLVHAHHGADPEGWAARLEQALAGGERVLVAEQDDVVVAYARCGVRAPADPDDPAPAGRWLTGAVVDPAHRRRGHARRLLGLLLAELRGAGEPVWSMAAADNEASLALHADLGFVEVLRAPRLLGEGFVAGGQGVLLRADPT